MALLNYTYDMILEKYSTHEYTYILKSIAGTILYEFTASNDPEAMRIAQAFMSTWSSVRITMKGDNEQQKRD
jgi:hypothetical protein